MNQRRGTGRRAAELRDEAAGAGVASRPGRPCDGRRREAAEAGPVRRRGRGALGVPVFRRAQQEVPGRVDRRGHLRPGRHLRPDARPLQRPPSSWPRLSCTPPLTTCWGRPTSARTCSQVLLYSLRDSYLVGFLGALFAGIIGLTIGFAAGWRGGLLDEVLQMFTNIVIMMPGPGPAARHRRLPQDPQRLLRGRLHRGHHVAMGGQGGEGADVHPPRARLCRPGPDVGQAGARAS